MTQHTGRNYSPSDAKRASADAAVAEVARLTAGIEALYKFVAAKWPEADDVLDEIQALIAKHDGDGS